MKKILTILCSIFIATNLIGCETNDKEDILNDLYRSYVVNTQSEGLTPLSYENWYKSIQGIKTEDNQQNKPTEGLTFSLSLDETYYVCTSMGSATDTHVIIPENYNGKPVKEIANSAFQSRSSLREITIPSTITSIGDLAFNACIGLESIVIPDSVESIGSNAFLYCPNVTNIYIGKNVSQIGENAFGNTDMVERITISENNPLYHSKDNCIIETASNKLVLGCKKSVIPDYVTTIGKYAFYECNRLQSIKLPNNVKIIEEGAFFCCASLSNIQLNDGLEHIYGSAFAGCNSLTSVTIPQSVTSISDSFRQCDSLTSVVMSNHFNRFSRVFEYCPNLTKVYYFCTIEEWNENPSSNKIASSSATKYYYSENKPTDTQENYWHYVDGVVTEWTK